MIPNWKDVVMKELIPTLRFKINKKKVIIDKNGTLVNQERESNFIKTESEKVDSMISGEY
jgi:hypothetical protein